MDSFVQCHYCKKNLTNPLELVCRHSYCSECITKEIQNDKVSCPVCSTEHTTQASSLSSAKQDTLVPYLIGLNRFVHSQPRILYWTFSISSVVHPMQWSRTIHRQQSSQNAVDVKKQRIFVLVITVRNHYVLNVEENTTKPRRKMLITQCIVYPRKPKV